MSGLNVNININYAVHHSSLQTFLNISNLFKTDVILNAVTIMAPLQCNFN